jgi:hypothetical protein
MRNPAADEEPERSEMNIPQYCVKLIAKLQLADIS